MHERNKFETLKLYCKMSREIDQKYLWLHFKYDIQLNINFFEMHLIAL